MFERDISSAFFIVMNADTPNMTIEDPPASKPLGSISAKDKAGHTTETLAANILSKSILFSKCFLSFFLFLFYLSFSFFGYSARAF